MPVLDPIVILAAKYCVAILFLSSSLAKARQFAVFRVTLADYRLLPEWAVGPVSAVVVIVEFGVGCGALIPFSTVFAMLLATGLLLLYGCAIGINLLRGRRDIDCGCTGPAVRQLLSGWLLLRNVCLAGLALLGAATPSARALGAADAVLVALSVLGAVALYAAANQLMVNAPRLDALDSLMDAA